MRGVKLILSLAVAIGAAGCSEDGDTVGPDTTASIRFVNAIVDARGSLLLTANGDMVGSALAYGSQASTCSSVDAGITVLSLNTSASGGNGIAGALLGTRGTNLAAGGNYTVIATGTSDDPQFIVLSNNSFDANLNSNQAAVRFINLMATRAGTFNIFTGANMFGEPTYADLGFAASTSYTVNAAGAQTFIFTNEDDEEIFRTSGQLDLQGGAAYTIAVMPAADGGFRLLPVTAC
jgi:hypothetical protein